MAEPIKMLFVLYVWMGRRNHRLDGGPDPPPMERVNFGEGKGAHIVKFRDFVPCAM